MNTLEIARKFAALGETAEACNAYKLALADCKDREPAAELECALHILQFGEGEDYKISYTCLRDLYNQGFAQADILAIMDGAFYQPNVKRLKRHYEKNCRLLSKYPYIFRKDFPAFEELPVIFFPYDDNQYTSYDVQKQGFSDFYNPTHQVISRNFFKDLEKPILAADVFSQYELEYLNDNVRKSEWVARENHIYLHYTSWLVFCAYLQVLDLQTLLKDKKIVFLIENEIGQYPIDFKERFGIDYSQYKVEPLHIREINRLIWHTQLSSDNGGDFFNEVFDSHPNLLSEPSLMYEDILEVISRYALFFAKCTNMEQVHEHAKWDNDLILRELFNLRNRSFKDIFVARFLNARGKTSPYLDLNSRIVPAIFFQPHFGIISYELRRNIKGKMLLDSQEYEKICNSPLLRGFKYIKTFTPMRTISSTYAATVKYRCYRVEEVEQEAIIDDTLQNKIKNRSFMIDWQNRLFKDCRLVRFEDGKLNAKATFTALAAFLDLPYTESMTYCSKYGEKDPLSDLHNDRGFNPATIYRKNADYGNDSERAFIEFCMRDVYKYYGYDFEYYDGQPVDKAKLKEWINNFSTNNRIMRWSMQKHFLKKATDLLEKELEEKEFQIDEQQLLKKSQQLADDMLNEHMEGVDRERLALGVILLDESLQFINKNGQPLHMMPMLKPDPDLLEMPLYRSTTYPHVDVEVDEFSHKEFAE